MAVAILLATYNGARYVEEQILSLLNQSHQDFHVFVRDDGSDDNTRLILEEFHSRDERITLLKDHENLGVSHNFFRLLEAAGSNFEFYAFCDQDDVWQKHKLHDAVEALAGKSIGMPWLYFSRLNVTDEALQIEGQSPVPKILSFENAISQNVVTGCTAVINSAARDLILRTPSSDTRLWAHDWWLYLVISRFGQLSYNSKPGILYRQHAQNLIGSKRSPLAQFIERIRSASVAKLDKRRPSKLVSLFVEVYGSNLEKREREFLDRASRPDAGVLSNLLLAFSPRWVRQNYWDTLVLRLRILLGKY